MKSSKKPELGIPGFEAEAGDVFAEMFGITPKNSRKSGYSRFLEFDDTILCYDAYYGEKKTDSILLAMSKHAKKRWSFCES